MSTLAKYINVVGAENRPLMLKKSMYDSWASRICLFIKGNKHGRMMLDSIDNGPLVYPIVEEDRQTRTKKYSELTKAQQLQDDCDTGRRRGRVMVVNSSHILIMNPQETQQVVTHDEKWVLFAERVKISTTNIRLETTMPQKEETFQVVIDIIKNSTCFKAFTISPTRSVLSMLKSLGQSLISVQEWKGLLNRHTNMFVDHMHQPWRTLAAIINKCLSGKTASNEKLRKSRIDIL
ncbi:hypothetical protein Tco_1199098 [Tanacetum coccineum]